MGTATIELDRDIAAYDAMRADLENRSMGEWVVVHSEQLQGVFPSLEQAAEFAVAKFGRGPYLIRQIGSPPVTLPASVMFRIQPHA